MNILLRCLQLRPARELHTLLAAASWRPTLLSSQSLPSCSTSFHHRCSFAADASTRPDGAAGANEESNKPRTKPELVNKFLGIQLAAQPERLRRKRLDIIKGFQRHEGDCGSPEVTVAIWTEQIRDLAKDFQSHRKNVHQIKKLEEMLNRRRRMLTYLRKKDFDAYCFSIRKLGLKDIYVDSRSEDRYLEGSVHGQPVDERVRRHRFAFHPENKLKKTSLWKRLRPKLMDEDPSLKLS